MTTIRNRRRHPRLSEEDRVAVTVLSAPDAPQLVNKTIFCSTADISAGGLRLNVRAPVPAKAVLILRVAFSSPLRAFRHVGHVVWRRSAEQGNAVTMGVELDEAACPSIVAWRDVIARKLDGAARAADRRQP
jgi:hypothetical protein